MRKFYNSSNLLIFLFGMKLAKAQLEVIAMKCVEVITLRSLEKTNIESMDELFRQVLKSRISGLTPEVRIYRHSMVETDFSIHIYGETRERHPEGTPLGQQLTDGLKGLGLLNHTVWVEAAALEFPHRHGGSTSQDSLELNRKDISIITNQQRKERTMEEEKKDAKVKVETLEAQLKEWGIDLEKFRAKGEKAKTEAKADLESEVALLRAKLKEAQKKLEELKKAGDTASGELRKGIENAWAELKKGFDRAATKFK
jgi:hypothetical protein